MLDDGAGSGDRTSREGGDARALRGALAGRLGAGHVAVELAQAEPKLAHLTQERLDRVPMARDAEPIGHAQQAVNPLGLLTVRHWLPVMS